MESPQIRREARKKMLTSNVRSTNACEACRRRKVKCSGDQPCDACVKHGWECVIGHTGRKRYSEAQVKKLLDKIESYEEQIARLDPNPATQFQPPSASPASISPPGLDARGFRPEDTTRHLSLTSPGPGVNNSRHSSRKQNESISSDSPATDLTSGPAFVAQVRSLFDMSKDKAPPRTEGTEAGSQTHTSIHLHSDETNHVTLGLMLSLEESQHLLDRFLFYLGVSQHFFDSRSFSDSMNLLFQSSETQNKQKQTTWYTEYLLVMAMAKLMDVEQHTSQPPGSELFTEALGRIPPLHLLNDGGVLIVEILTLIATYLQWCDQKIGAYMHIGIALRLSIALGCNLPENEQTCLSSQGTHRLRLWWTVYMLDRRLSSSLGLAAGADERQLRVGLPRHAIGFQSPVALTINIRIARVTDDIMTSLYGNAAVAQVELVCKVQAILQELHNIGQAFPRSLFLDFSQPLQTVTRTGASLYLMLFQAIILCTRPMLLRRVRLEVRRQDESQPPEPDTLTRFCDTCIEAATRSLAILYILRLQRAIPRYGFFDLEATFSAAFIHIMVGFLSKTKEQPQSLGQAFEVLRFLARSGNPAAGKRLQDITQSSLHIWPNHEFDIEASNQAVVELDPDATERARCENLRPPQRSHFPQEIVPLSDGHPYGLDENEYSEPWDTLDPITPVYDMQGDLATHNPGEAEVIYSSFYNPTLPLTGVDYMDWLEVEKLLNAPAC